MHEIESFKNRERQDSQNNVHFRTYLVGHQKFQSNKKMILRF